MDDDTKGARIGTSRLGCWIPSEWEWQSRRRVRGGRLRSRGRMEGDFGESQTWLVFGDFAHARDD